LVGNFYAIKICAAAYRLTLRKFETMHEAARAYNAVRRLGCPRRDLKFLDVNSAAGLSGDVGAPPHNGSVA
jgi:hypothetical protein